MGGQHEVTKYLRIVLGDDVADGEEIALGLGHLDAVDVQESVVHPIFCKRYAVGSLRLRDLVLVVREYQVFAAGVNVDLRAEVALAHDRALDVPAGSSLAPGAIPIRLSLFLRLPQDEIQRVLLLVGAGHLEVAVAAAHVVEVLVGELAVALKFPRAVVNGAVLGDIGVALVDQSLDHFDHSVDLLRCPGVHGRGLDVEARHILLALIDVSLGDDCGVDALFLGLLDDLVIDVREVGYIVDLVSFVFKIAPDRVKNDHGTRISDVDQVVDGGSAYIHAHLAGFERHKFLFGPGHCVKDLHCIPHFPFLAGQFAHPPSELKTGLASRSMGEVISATACTEIPSPRPVNPSHSSVVAFTLT